MRPHIRVVLTIGALLIVVSAPVLLRPGDPPTTESRPDPGLTAARGGTTGRDAEPGGSAASADPAVGRRFADPRLSSEVAPPGRPRPGAPDGTLPPLESVRSALLAGPLGEMALPRLFDRYSRSTGPARRAASIALLLRKEETLAHLLATLARGRAGTRTDALLFLQKVAKWKEAAPAVLALLEDVRVSEGLRLRALATAAVLGAEDAADHAARSLARDASEEIREVAAIALERLEPSPPTLRALRGALSDESPRVAAAAAGALLSLGSDEGAPLLLELSRHEEWTVRRRAARALGAADGGAAGERLAALARSDESPGVRDAARMALHTARLRTVEPGARTAHLSALLGDPDPTVAVWAADRLRESDPEAARAAFRERWPASPPHLRFVFLLGACR